MSEKSKEKGNVKIAVVRVRGSVHVNEKILDTLSMLHLKRVNHCVVIDNAAVPMGMVKKAKDYITWGEIDEKTLTRLLEKWGRIEGDKKLSHERLKEKNFSSIADFSKNIFDGKAKFSDVGLKPVFKLHPPSKGYERGGIKKHFNIGGALGYRGAKINDLIAKMAGLKTEHGSKGQKDREKKGQ